MVKKKLIKVNKGPNNLKERLESGKDIKHLIGYVEESLASDDIVGVEVKVLRIDASECGVKIIVTPTSGFGEFPISPCQWYDDKAALEFRRNYLARCEEAKERLSSMFRHTYLTQRKEAFLDYVEGMGEEEMTALRQEVIERFGIKEDTAFNKLALKLSEAACRDIAKALICKDLEIDINDINYW